MDKNIDTEQFIMEIESRRAIWDASSPDYSDRDLKKKCWEDILYLFGGEELTLGEKKILELMLQKRWKGIRSSYTRELKRQKHVKSGSGVGNRKSEYIYFQHLQFLQNVVTLRDSPEEEEEIWSNEEVSERPNKIMKRKSKRQIAGDEDPFVGALNDSVERIQRLERAEEDEDRLFLLSLHSTLKGLPRHRKMSTKIKILSILNEASED